MRDRPFATFSAAPARRKNDNAQPILLSARPCPEFNLSARCAAERPTLSMTAGLRADVFQVDPSLSTLRTGRAKAGHAGTDVPGTESISVTVILAALKLRKNGTSRPWKRPFGHLIAAAVAYFWKSDGTARRSPPNRSVGKKHRNDRIVRAVRQLLHRQEMLSDRREPSCAAASAVRCNEFSSRCHQQQRSILRSAEDEPAERDISAGED